MIRTSGLCYRYAGGDLLRFGDVDVEQGGVLLVHGPSGCGKSTWLALVAGLLRPNAGSVHVAGQDLGQLRPVATDAWRARSIGFLPQKLHLSEALSVAGNLALAQWVAGVADNTTDINQVLSTLGLAGLEQRRPSQLSGGQAQRVALGRAVLLRPQVILADEPTASLDDAAARDALQLLRDSATRLKATLVIATHDARVRAGLPQAPVLALGQTVVPGLAVAP